MVSATGWSLTSIKECRILSFSSNVEGRRAPDRCRRNKKPQLLAAGELGCHSNECSPSPLIIQLLRLSPVYPSSSPPRILPAIPAQKGDSDPLLSRPAPPVSVRGQYLIGLHLVVCRERCPVILYDVTFYFIPSYRVF